MKYVQPVLTIGKEEKKQNWFTWSEVVQLLNLPKEELTNPKIPVNMSLLSNKEK